MAAALLLIHPKIENGNCPPAHETSWPLDEDTREAFIQKNQTRMQSISILTEDSDWHWPKRPSSYVQDDDLV